MHSANITTNNFFNNPRTSTVVHHGRRKGTLLRGSMADPFRPTPPVGQHKATVLPRLEGKRLLESVSNRLNTLKTSRKYTPVVQHGRRKGAIPKLTSAEVTNNLNPPEDQHEVLVLPMSEWKEAQDRARGVNREKERLAEAAREREAMFLRSKEASKDWPDSFPAQRQRLLEEKKMREQLNKDERRRIDVERARLEQMKRQLEFEREQALQTLKEFHSTMKMAEVLKERETQIEMKKKRTRETKELEKEFGAMIRCKDKQDLQQDREKALEKRSKCQELTEDWDQQVKVKEEAREIRQMRQMKEDKKVKLAHEQLIKEDLREKQKKREDMRNFRLKAHEEHLAHKNITQASEAERRKLEEERRTLYVESKDSWMKLWEEEKEKRVKESQRPKDVVANKLARRLKDRIAREKADDEMKKVSLQLEKKGRYTAQLKSLADHRETLLEAVKRDHHQRNHRVTKSVKPIFSAHQLTKTVHLPKLVDRSSIQSIEELREATSLQDSKDRLGLSWQW